MKRIGCLFERVIDPDNLRLAFVKASRGKRCRDDQRQFQSRLDEELARLRQGLIDGDYPVGDYRRFLIHDPKEREICAASFGERVLHHALMNVCEPYFDRWLVDDTFACRRGKGQLAAVRRAQTHARRHAWFMKCDFRKYFDSIPHDGVVRLLNRKFKDAWVLSWFARILNAYEKMPGRGLPIGNLTSQHFANLYLDGLDRLAGKPTGAYVRYMDDFVFWADAKADLKAFRAVLADFVREGLSLSFKQEPFINRTRLGMDFLGIRVFPDGVRLSRTSRRRYVAGVRRCEWAHAHGLMGEDECQARETALAAFAAVESRAWRRKHLAFCMERRATTASTAAAAGTTTPGTVAPRTATGTPQATATTTWASASLAPQHRRMECHAVPAERLFPKFGTNTNRRAAVVGPSDEGLEPSASPSSSAREGA